MYDRPLEVKVWGPLACFTRPEMKVERVSYPVMTPSAARGVLEAIFWKPEFAWVVEEIRVLNEIRYFSILRNEVNSRASERAAASWQRAGSGGFDVTADRSQRHTLALRDVGYVIQARMALRPDVREDQAKYRDQFRRRVRRGQCFSRPYLGCREFAADFCEPDGSEQPISHTEDLGPMLLDLQYTSGSSGVGTPRFFEARLENGMLRVPDRLAEEVA
ncbi:MAG: type I-C CRISPR-associated protein Cas5 [Chloroflexi bacterium]|nr:type I-C CRISPR-associated protein Cas5 [Chloroflexota bacterium]